MTDKTTADDEDRIVNLDVGGKNPVEQVRGMLSGYDLDDTDISRISIEVFERVPDEPASDPADPGGQTPKTAGDGGKKTWSTLTEDDRELKGVQEGSSHHLVLAALAEAAGGAGDEGIAPTDLSGPLGVDRNNVSTVLSKLYRRRLVERETGSRPYTYFLNSHGRAELDELGRDVTPEDVGGVWVNDDA